MFVITLDAVVVNVALPAIRTDLGAGMTGLQWVVDGYTLPFAALLLPFGALADRVGARTAFGSGTIVLAIASAACALVPSLPALVTARVVQGAAAAVVMPASMALLGQVSPDPVARAKAVGAWAMGGAVASTSGPVLGGLLTLASWRLLFLVNVPVGALILVMLRRTPASPTRQSRYDWVGQAGAVVAMGGVTFGAIEAGSVGLTSPTVVGALVVALAATAAFVISQAKGRHPMVPPALVAPPAVRAVTLTGFTFMVCYYGLPFVMSLFLQQQRGLSALQTGAVFLPMMLAGAALTPLSARLVARLGTTRVVASGLLLMAAGLVTLAFLPATTPVAGLAAVMVLVGLGGPTVSPPLTAALLHATPSHLAGTASGVLNTSRQLGGALAVAVFGTLLTKPDTFTTGMRTALLVAAGISVITIAATPYLRPARVADDVARSRSASASAAALRVDPA
ncbi:MAG TPA: MFS transporter [Actinomycetales bacterium]|nr:MFS transporter [Actinomycetales bacterium]